MSVLIAAYVANGAQMAILGGDGAAQLGIRAKNDRRL
jgi:hypothetical protein